MLRLGFLPSDFNPMLLILGEAEDFRRLAAVLRRFAADGVAQRLDALPGAVAGVTLDLAPAVGAPGLVPLPAPGAGFTWGLDPARVAEFAARAEALAVPDRPAGSEILACGGAEEVPVVLSRGEYTDDFLLPGPGRHLAGDARVRQ
jgi:hypothetical protein